MSPRHDAFVSQAHGRSLLALSSLVGLTGADPESRTTWIHVAPFGEWSGHSEGKFSLTADHFQAVCAQVRSKATPVSLDYEHASIRPSGGPTPAAGYVVATEVRDDGLYACVEFTPRAAEMIKAGEYRFCSGVFDFASVDSKTGAPLTCALDTIALTNRPFIDGQKPIVLSRLIPLTAGVSMSEIDLKALAKLLDAIPGPNTKAKIKAALELMSADDAPAPDAPADAEKADASKSTSGKVALTDPAPAVALADKPADAAPCADPMPPAPMPMADPMPTDDVDNDVDSRLMAATGLDEAGLAAKIDECFDAVVAVLMGQAAPTALSRDVEITQLRASNVTLTKENNQFRALTAKAADAAIVAEVDASIGVKFTPDHKPALLALARKAPAEFRDLAARMPTLSLTKPHASALPPPTTGSENTAGGLPESHPRVVAHREALTAIGLSKDVIDKKIAELRG